MTADYDFWLFDLDGTLVDVESRYIREVIAAVGEAIDYTFTDRQATRLWHAIGGPPEAQLQSWGVDPTEFWTAFHTIEDPSARAEATFLYPDAADVGSLDRRTALVTHCQPEITAPVLSALDIADWFDAVVCCHDELGWKPDPGPVELAMTEIGMHSDAHDGVLVGNTAADVGAARNAGLAGIHVERQDPADRDYRIRADVHINGVHEVLPTES